jgi:hypothetical protein
LPKHRKISLVLSPEEYDTFHGGWFHARFRGTPLNTFVTFRLVGVDDMTPDERWKLWSKILKKLDQYARSKDFEPVKGWVRESKRITKTIGKGEHLHVLLWVPEGLEWHFRKTVTGWFEGRHAVVVKPASQITRASRNGKKAHSAATYVTKAAPPQRTYNNPTLAYEKSGPIQGKRAGLSRNLMPKAVTTWRPRRASEAASRSFRTDGSRTASRSAEASSFTP